MYDKIYHKKKKKEGQRKVGAQLSPICIGQAQGEERNIKKGTKGLSRSPDLL